MSRITFKLDLPGLNQLMKSGEMQSILNDAAARIAGAAGPGFEAEGAHPIGFVAINSVRTATWAARKLNSSTNALEKAAGGVRI